MPLNLIAIEIEVSLAFGTGHHASTRGCLLAIDQIVKAHRPRRVRALTHSGSLSRCTEMGLPQFVGY